MAKIKNHTLKEYTLQATNRALVRAEVFKLWIEESPGTSEITNTYRYNVERLSDGSVIYLNRPTRLNKGADFVICCEGFTKFKNGNDKPPSHRDIFSEVQELAHSEERKSELLAALDRIWNCEASATVIGSLKAFKGNARAERVLLLAKWFFIEQDVTYWTDSGRHMLRSGFESQFGPLS